MQAHVAARHACTLLGSVRGGVLASAARLAAAAALAASCARTCSASMSAVRSFRRRSTSFALRALHDRMTIKFLSAPQLLPQSPASASAQRRASKQQGLDWKILQLAHLLSDCRQAVLLRGSRCLALLALMLQRRLLPVFHLQLQPALLKGFFMPHSVSTGSADVTLLNVTAVTLVASG